MKIELRLISGFLVVALLVGVVGVLGLNASQQIEQYYGGLSEEFWEDVDAAVEAQSYAKRAEGHLMLYLTLDTEVDKEKFFARHKSLEEQIAILERVVTTPVGIEQVENLKSASADILSVGRQLIEAHDSNPEAFDPKDYAELVRGLNDAASDARRAGVDIAKLETVAARANVETRADATALQGNIVIYLQRNIIIIQIVTVILAVGIGLYISRSISKPITKLRDAAMKIGGGELETKIEVRSKDEIGELANAFNTMSSELRGVQERLLKTERMATIGEIATMVGHDLRNPMQAIINMIHLAEKKLKALSYSRKDKRDVEEMLRKIAGETEYMNKIVSDLQDYAKPMKPELVETSLHKLITDTLSTITVPETVKVSTVIKKDFPKLMIDQTLMKRVLTNLVLNALQAMPNGGHLTIRASKTEETASISIQDTGAGIPKENMDKIFQPLFTTKSKGTGLGLAVCKRLVEAHDGSITAESELGKGTTFTITIPLGKEVSLDD